MSARARSLAAGVRAPACLLALSLSACVSLRNEAYPLRWPPIASGGADCASVAGTYADEGERVGRNAFEHDSLSAQLGALKSMPIGARTERVGISFAGDGALDVAVSAPDGRSIATLRFSRGAGEFRCPGASIEMTVRSALLVEEQVAARETETVALSRATDGALILARSRHAYGVTGGIIPIFAGGVESWSRFRPVASN